MVIFHTMKSMWHRLFRRFLSNGGRSSDIMLLEIPYGCLQCFSITEAMYGNVIFDTGTVLVSYL